MCVRVCVCIYQLHGRRRVRQCIPFLVCVCPPQTPLLAGASSYAPRSQGLFPSINTEAFIDAGVFHGTRQPLPGTCGARAVAHQTKKKH